MDVISNCVMLIQRTYVSQIFHQKKIFEALRTTGIRPTCMDISTK